MKSFQSLFPPLSPKTTSLSSARRVVLVSYNPERGTVDVRHYVITVKPFGVSKRVRRLVEGASIPANASTSTGTLDLGREKDVADFLLRKRGEPGPDGLGYESAASSAGSVAGDDGDTVSLAGDYVGRNNRKGQKKAVRLDEVGPRLELRLVKITEGPPGKEGAVMYHEFGEFSDAHDIDLLFTRRGTTVKKTKKEVAALKTSHAERERIRKARREEQERNVERKKEQSSGKKHTQGEEGEDEDEEASEEEDRDEGGWDEEEEITEGEESQDDSEASEDEEEEPRPTKKVKIRNK